ncbi:hypothetical protein A2U01_0094716, partial [Trifolium medium]|nr:hypothetical protein [Trifolium medium]
AVSDPLSQLVVDDPTSKGSKRKNPEETTRISIQVPKKGEDATTEGDATDAPLGPAKKKGQRGVPQGALCFKAGAHRTSL